MSNVPSLTAADLLRAFNTAMVKVKGYIGSHDLNCSTDVVFDGLSENTHFAVDMWFTGEDGKFHLEFSKHYLGNKREKIEKLFFRYIVTSNLDGTFKNYTQVKDELRKLPFETHYDVTYQNDYLNTDITTPFNGVICDKCHRAFRYDPGARIFSHLNRFMCVCGGSLTAIINGVKQVSANSVERYTVCDPKQLDKLRSVDFTPLKGFSAEVQLTIRNAINTAGRLNTRIMRSLILTAVNNGSAELLRALDAAFTTVYTHTYSKLSTDLRKRVYALAVPSTLTNANVKFGTSGTWADTRWADDGPLVTRLKELFFANVPTDDDVRMDVIVNTGAAPELAPWPRDVEALAMAAFFELSVEDALAELAARDQRELAADGPTVDDVEDARWRRVASVFFNEGAPAADEPCTTSDETTHVDKTTHVDEGAQVEETMCTEGIVLDNGEAAQAEKTAPAAQVSGVDVPKADVPGVDWGQVARVFFSVEHDWEAITRVFFNEVA